MQAAVVAAAAVVVVVDDEDDDNRALKYIHKYQCILYIVILTLLMHQSSLLL